MSVRKEGKLGAYALKRVAAGAPLPTPWLFEPAKRPDDRAGFCLNRSVLHYSANTRYSCIEGYRHSAMKLLVVSSAAIGCFDHVTQKVAERRVRLWLTRPFQPSAWLSSSCKNRFAPWWRCHSKTCSSNVLHTSLESLAINVSNTIYNTRFLLKYTKTTGSLGKSPFYRLDQWKYDSLGLLSYLLLVYLWRAFMNS